MGATHLWRKIIFSTVIMSMTDIIFDYRPDFTDTDESFLILLFVLGTCLLVGVPPIADDSCKK